jgi:hypothetical protein
MDNQKKFYLGRIFDSSTSKVSDQPLLYDADDLTTHAVVVGMTGSGKTGLCIGMLEEAALRNIPALLIDPKGDLTNLLLHFPNLLPSDFQPWINTDQARREGKTVEQSAVETAETWRKGLQQWGIEPERILALEKSAQFQVFTPGSDSGAPVSILASLKAPEIPWESNREVLREKISGTVTALLGLVGLSDIDPVRSREHILLSNIFEHAWSQGHDLDLSELILQTQSPPFSKLGVFDVNTFFPEKDRFGLAMTLNNILAAPAFQSWINGEPLNIPSLLYTRDGRPRHSVFYIAHLNETERMFFVALLYAAIEGWMRTQSGSTTLRALVYFDEIFGYLPPVSNPPAKQTILRMLKQARAFGVGMVLATQNPVDIDYKALSNAGTWMIGKLQTDKDKQRLLDGLQGAASGDMDRGMYDRLISTLGKRVFLMHNVHRGSGTLFQTRWVMNYLAGPLTRTQIPALNQLHASGETTTLSDTQPVAAKPRPAASQAAAGYQAAPAVSAAPQRPPQTPSAPGSMTRPAVPTGVAEYILPNNLTFSQALRASGQSYSGQTQTQGLLYRPVILGQAHIRFLNRRYNLDTEQFRVCLVLSPDRRGVIRWENFPAATLDPYSLDDTPAPGALFAALEAPFSDTRIMSTMKKDFHDWAFRSGQITVRANETLKVYAGPDVTQANFLQMCAEAARQQRDAEITKTADTFDKRIATIQTRLQREERELSEDETRHSQRKLEEMGTHAENVLGLFGGKRSSRRLSSSLSKRRLTEQAKANVEESKAAIADFKRQISQIEKEKAQALENVTRRWNDASNQVDEISIVPLKKDVLLDLFGIAWMPYHLVEVNGQTIELPGYGQA